MQNRLRFVTVTLFLTLVAPFGCTSEGNDPDDVSGDAGGTSAKSDAGSAGGQGGISATLGRNDDVAKHACDAWAGKLASSVTSKTVSAVQNSDYAELAEARLSVNGDTLYTVNLPAGKESWLALDENFWSATLGFFAAKGVAYEVLNSEIKPESDGPLKNGACPDTDLTDYRLYFEHWSPARVRFSAEGPRQLKFMIMRDEANSVPLPSM